MQSSSAPHGAGLPFTLLAYWLMSIVGQDFLIALPEEVAVEYPSTIAFRDAAPHQAAARLATVANGGVSNYLRSAWAQRNPDPPLVRAPIHQRPYLIQLQNLSLGRGGSQRLLQSSQVFSFFEPASQGVTREAKDAADTSQGGALMVGAQDLFLAGGLVGGTVPGSWVKERAQVRQR